MSCNECPLKAPPVKVTPKSYIKAIVTMGLGRLMMALKSKIRSMKVKKPYDKIEKSESMRVEIRSRKARKLIEQTLRIADSPKSKTYAF
ncbi:hypothetical protein RJ641_006596 [Dillenia turbinata]|uniref:Uncharacterized protein n=1 Tax=Dillenia turbinata TaxID=194707 RepID=A0AAN8ZA87_9MAGN